MPTTNTKLIDFAEDIYLITSFDIMWNKWNEVFKKQWIGKYIKPNTGMAMC